MMNFESAVQRIRFDLAVDYLLVLNRILGKHVEFFANASSRAHKQANNSLSRLKSMQTLISDEENGLWYHKWSIEKAIDQLTKIAAKYYKNIVTALIFKTSEEIARELMEFIGSQTEKKVDGVTKTIRKGMIQQIWGLKEDILYMIDNFNKKLKAFEYAESHLIFENLYKPELFHDYYYIETSDKNKIEIDDELLKQFEMQLNDKLQIKSLFNLIQEKEDIGLGKIIAKIESFGRLKFTTSQFDVDAIKLFYEKYGKDPTELTRKIEHFADYGKIWLRKSAFASVDTSVTGNYGEEVEIGIDQKGMRHTNYEDFQKQLKISIQKHDFKGNIGSAVDVSKDCVYIYNEYAGIPLMFIGGLDKYKEAYIDELIENDRTLHIDRNDDKFVDILTKREDEVRAIIMTTRLLLACSILRIIDLEVDQEEVASYVYQDYTQYPPRPRPLGTRQIAVEILKKDLRLSNKLEKKLDDVQKKMNDDQRKKYFNILTYHYVGNDYEEYKISPGPFPITWIKVGMEYIEKFTPEHRAIQKLVSQQVEILKQKMDCEGEYLNKLFTDGYFSLDDYSEKITVSGKGLRIFKKDEVDDLIKNK